MRDWKSVVTPKAIVQAAVLGATSAGTTAVDMGTCRDSLLAISITVGTDVPTSFEIEESSDNITFASKTTVTDANLAASTIYTVEVQNHKRYLRAKWTRATAAGDSYWSVLVFGHEAVHVGSGLV